jgi:branched-chain amino acid transport system ATP-binding protein
MERLLCAHHVMKRYGKFVALADVSLNVGKSEIVAVVGPNGAGKTTLVNSLSGLSQPDAGDILFEGKSILGLSPSQLSLRGLSRSFQLVSIFPDLTVAETISVGAYARARQTFCLFRPVSLSRDIAHEVEVISAAFGLTEALKTQCRMLSQGQKKLVDIASALALRPKLMLLDEPTSGISTLEKYALMEKLIEAARVCLVESLLLVEHDMELVERYATRVVGLKSGAIVADLPPAEFFANAQAVEALVGRVTHRASH